MPLPMVHLLLAEKIGEKAGKEPDAYFLLGSIAPDAIHMRPGSTRKDKHKTHFFCGKHWDEEEVQAHWNIVVAKFAEQKGMSPQERSFFAGYYIHTLLDMAWVVHVFNALADTLRAGGIGFEEVRTKYYAETNACDAFLYQNSHWTQSVKEKLLHATPLEVNGLLTAEEIGLWRDVVLEKMNRYEKTVPKEVFYINNENIQHFTDVLAKKAYRLL